MMQFKQLCPICFLLQKFFCLITKKNNSTCLQQNVTPYMLKKI